MKRIITDVQLQMIADYILSVPTGNRPASVAVEVLQMLRRISGAPALKDMATDQKAP